MIPLSPSIRCRRAITLVEMLLAMTILSVMMLAVSPMFKLTQHGFSSIEAHSMLKSEGQDAINRITHRLVECKRLFENTAGDTPFLARAQFTTAAPVLTGSRLPALEEMGALSPSSATFVAASVGNRLFFASVIPPLDVDAADASADVRTVRIDQYVFNAYYLGVDNAKTIGGAPRRELWEWHSVTYADYNQLAGIPDATRRENVVIAFVAAGVTRAWNPSVTSVNAAFYLLDGAGVITADAAQMIPELSAKRMVKVTSGMMSGGYRYGISPNTSAGFQTSHPVPRFGAATGNFPSGFEVVAVGPNSARQVFIRMVLAAQGSFSGNISSEQVSLTTVRDLW